MLLILRRSDVLISARRPLLALLLDLSDLVALLYLSLELILILLLVLSPSLNDLRLISDYPRAGDLILRQRLMLGGLGYQESPFLILVAFSPFLVGLVVRDLRRW